MQRNVPQGEFHYPTKNSLYSDPATPTVLVTAMIPEDTSAFFDLPSVAAPNFAPYYTLPGLPYNLATTPQQKLMKATGIRSGNGPYSVLILPPDWALTPVPLLADFRAIMFQEVNDFAIVRWTGSLWTLVETGGAGTVVVVPGQTFP